MTLVAAFERLGNLATGSCRAREAADGGLALRVDKFSGAYCQGQLLGHWRIADADISTSLGSDLDTNLVRRGSLISY